MRAELIDGKAIAADVRADVARDVAALRERGVVPGLVVVLVGDDVASATYVGAKEKASREAGMSGGTVRLPAATTQAELLRLVEELNGGPMHSGGGRCTRGGTLHSRKRDQRQREHGD